MNDMAVRFKCSSVVFAVFHVVTQAAAGSLGVRPMLRVIPMPDPQLVPNSPVPVLIRTNLIHYNLSDRSSVLRWTQKIDKFLQPYRRAFMKHPENLVACSYLTSPLELPKSHVCDVPVDDFHPCTASNQYNYDDGAPCVFLKLDDVLNWQLKLYNATDLIAEEMPGDLKDTIRMIAGYPKVNTVWVSCEGESPADVENIGPVQYIPRRGFPAYYYPFTNKEGYLSPLVAVLFERPRKHVVINVECKAWTRDFSHGPAQFQLLVD